MSTMKIAPEVGEFLASVRSHLADLDPEEQREILDGLEADLGELVSERGAQALGDPAAYAAELRTAAGLSAEAGRSRIRRPSADVVHALLDGAGARWSAAVAGLPFDVAGLLTELRPVWWVLRAWIAVQVGLLWSGGWALTVIPDESVDGALVTLAAFVLSIQLGRGRLWPGERLRTVAALRLVLLALNILAVVMVPAVVSGLNHGHDFAREQGFQSGYAQAQNDGGSGPGADRAGMYVDGKWVSNIYPYDAQGRPLVGVQLFNQIGQPINVVTQPEYAVPEIDDNGVEVDADGNPIDPTEPTLPRIFYPWTNGVTQLFNVFPLPSRLQDSEELSPTAFSEKDRPQIGKLPLASVPPASLPGISTTTPKAP